MNFSKKNREHRKNRTFVSQTLNHLILLCTIFLVQGTVFSQDFEETITKGISLNSNASVSTLVVQNVNGPIEVEAYQGNTIKLEVDKIIKAKNSENVTLGKQEIGIKIEEKGNKIFVYLDSPWTEFNIDTERYRHNENYNGHNTRKYYYHLNFRIKVPKSLNLKLATMNDGDIHVINVQPNELIVNNLNGAITLDNISGRTDVNALNKDINISYSTNPKDDSKYNSLNGDINITLKQDLNADVTFKSLNGDFYTNFDTVKLNPQMTKKTVKNGKGVKYKLNSREAFQIGNGGIKLDFNLLNGDVTVKKI